MWILEVPGPKPPHGRPPWVRHGRLPEGTSEDDVMRAVSKLAVSFGCARARGPSGEVTVMRNYRSVLRTP